MVGQFMAKQPRKLSKSILYAANWKNKTILNQINWNLNSKDQQEA